MTNLKLNIDILDKDNRPMLNIKHSISNDESTLTQIGMYLDGEITNSLCSLNKKQLMQLHETLGFLLKE